MVTEPSALATITGVWPPSFPAHFPGAEGENTPPASFASASATQVAFTDILGRKETAEEGPRGVCEEEGAERGRER